ncbi:integrase arm-type DNA-binding domain-containing protein [Nordella sp. HKS 07]|uniref:Arm DNA-binding domain-containing protein n=1 Tax=Nordella sp. HKS 07 TaxID=2712222 RepID=UPI00352C5B77
MARAIHKLKFRQVETLKKVGRHSDGGGLYLKITPDGSKRWVFMYARAGRQREMGLGSAQPGGVSWAMPDRPRKQPGTTSPPVKIRWPRAPQGFRLPLRLKHAPSGRLRMSISRPWPRNGRTPSTRPNGNIPLKCWRSPCGPCE